MITEELKSEVKKEADNILKFVPLENRIRLKISILNSTMSTMCVYGQMFGSCFGYEATQAILNCGKPYSNELSHYEAPIRGFYDEINYSRIDFTPLEFYISQPEAKNANLIAYLRGESNTLEL